MIILIISIIFRVLCALSFIGFALGMCLYNKHPIFEKIGVISMTAIMTIGSALMCNFMIFGK